MDDKGFLGAPDGSLADYISHERRKAARTIANRRGDLKMMEDRLAGAIAADEFLASELSERDLARAFDYGAMISFDAVKRVVSVSHARVSPFRNCPRYMGLDDMKYGVLNGGAGRLDDEGDRFYGSRSIAADPESLDEIARDFAREIRRYAIEALSRDLCERARRKDLPDAARDELKRRFYERGLSESANYLDYQDLADRFEIDHEGLKAWLSSLFIEFRRDDAFMKAARGCRGFMETLFGEKINLAMRGHFVINRGMDPFYRAHAYDEGKFRDLVDSGNRASLVTGLIICARMSENRHNGRLRDSETGVGAKALEIIDGGLSHPGQIVSLVKTYLGVRHEFSLEAGADVDYLYRGLLRLGPEILPGGLREADCWGGALRPWLRDLCWISARAGEWPVRVAAWRLLARVVRDARESYRPHSGRADFERLRADALEFLARFWRLLSREDGSGRKWADIRREAKAIEAGFELFGPAHEAGGCECQAGRTLPRSMAWSGLVKSMEEASRRCYIERLERERRYEEARGGVVSWTPALGAPVARDGLIAREIKDSAGMRALGGELNNCLGGIGWSLECETGKRMIFSVSAIEEGSPGGCFAVSRKDGVAYLGEIGVKRRGKTFVTRERVEAVARETIAGLNAIFAGSGA